MTKWLNGGPKWASFIDTNDNCVHCKCKRAIIYTSTIIKVVAFIYIFIYLGD